MKAEIVSGDDLEVESIEIADGRCFDLGYRIAYRILGSREEAEDVAAETLARAQLMWTRLAAQPEPWVVTVASRLALDRWRRLSRSQPVRGVGAGTADAASGERIDLVRALQRLSRRQRDVVVLRYLADRPETEVATALGCSLGTVRTHAARGLAALREALTPREDNAAEEGA
jgi:RNA polymerase sigma factor (sigma-70 family)